jgi:hypothetical protein
VIRQMGAAWAGRRAGADRGAVEWRAGDWPGSRKSGCGQAAGQDVEQEAAQELLRTERHHSLLITVGIILPTENNLVMLKSHEAMVGDGYAMGIAGEIAELQELPRRRAPFDSPNQTGIHRPPELNA